MKKTCAEKIKSTPKEHPIPPIIVDMEMGKNVICRRCGQRILEPYDRYCSHCGQRIKPYAYGGSFGWTSEKAEFVWQGDGE